MSNVRPTSSLARWKAPAMVLGAMGVSAALLLPRLGDRLFWDDEANTAIYARNLLHFGRITAWDGTNLCGYGMGGALGEDLGQELRVPTLSAYVAAASMAIFGQTTFAGRLPFALAGIASVGLVAIWMRRHFGRRFPCWLPAWLLAISPAFLLYSRNCRYYSMGLMFSLAVLVCWAPGRRRGGRQTDGWFSREDLLRLVSAAVAFALLINTHYLNAAALLVVLPLMFLDRRYRQRRQYLLFAVLLVTAAADGAWIFATANPLRAHYETGQAWLFAPPPIRDRWERFSANMCWFVRDLGSHEFLPWLLLPVFLLPLLPWRRTARVRPIAWRGFILAAMAGLYTLAAAAAMPADMGKGPAAEMRYLVPLIAVGSVLGGVALKLLWRIGRLAAIPAAVLLVGTNWLFLGGTIERFDRPNAWWPPTLYCYLCELREPFRGGDEELVDLLARLPEGTSVRIWPSFMTYPPMFYVPGLHYCDQLTEDRPIRADLRSQLPDYLFAKQARPEVVVVPAAFLGMAMQHLKTTCGPLKYRVCKVLKSPFLYTQKPEIPMHWFWRPAGVWTTWPAGVVLVAEGSAADKSPALVSDLLDRERGAYVLWNIAAQATEAGDLDVAVEKCQAALRLDPQLVAAHISLGAVSAARHKVAEALRHYRAALAIEPANAVAHFDLANTLLEENENEEAEQHYRQALAARPDYIQAHFNLGVMLLRLGRAAEAREHISAAQRSAAPGTRLAVEARRLLEQMPK